MSGTCFVPCIVPTFAASDNHESISIGASEMARTLKQVPTFKFLGHSEMTTALSQWHAQYVLDTPTLLYASLSSITLRDRALRPLILAKINAEAKTYIRSTFVRESGLFVTYTAALHSWRFKDSDVWSSLFALNEYLACKKPPHDTIRDWRLKLDKWRTQRRALAGTDIDSDHDHIWLMRCLESLSRESWYKKFRKQMASDEARGIYILDIDSFWEKVQFEETWVDEDAASRVNHLEPDDGAYKRSKFVSQDDLERSNRFDRDASVAVIGARGRGRGDPLARGRNDAQDADVMNAMPQVLRDLR